MAQFIGMMPSLDVGDEGNWILEEPLTYQSDVAAQIIEVPAGFVTDLASVPKWVPRWVVDVNESHRFAAVVHDFACRTWILELRPVADAVFKEAMAVLGVPGWKRWTMWFAVRSFTVWLTITRREE